MPSFASKFRLDGKVALVVGGGSGIGRATARAMGDLGATVLCADVNDFNAAAVTKEINDAGARGEALHLDITQSESVKATFDSVKSKQGHLDIVVSTPAVNVRKRMLNYTEEEFDKVIALNLKGTFRVLQHAGRVMYESGGSIIALSSIRSLVVEPGQGVYAATKAGLVQLVRGFAVELAPKVRVNAVAPGVVDTPLTAPIKANKEWYEAYSKRSALGRWAREDELAGPIAFLASDASSYITGTVLFVDGGWTAIDGRFEPPL